MRNPAAHAASRHLLLPEGRRKSSGVLNGRGWCPPKVIQRDRSQAGKCRQWKKRACLASGTIAATNPTGSSVNPVEAGCVKTSRKPGGVRKSA